MAISKSQYVRGIILRPDDVGAENIEGELKVSLSTKRLQVYLDGALRNVVTTNQTQTLSLKTIDADVNTINNLEVDNLKANVLNVSATLDSASDTQVPSALAVKTYVDNKDSEQNEASEISFAPVGNIAATDVQAMGQELDADLSAEIARATAAEVTLQNNINAETGARIGVQTNLTTHINNTTGAHAASAISNSPSGNLAATNVQTALNELQTDIDTRATSSALSAHTGVSSGVHGIAGAVVGTTDYQSISNKTISTVTNAIQVPSLYNNGSIELVQNLQQLKTDIETRATSTNFTTHTGASSGVHGVIGNVVGTTDTQTLTNKTITSASIQAPIRSDVKQDTKANLVTYAASATNGQVVFATDEKLMYQVVDNALVAVGGASGSLDTILQLKGDDVLSWVSGNNAAFLGGGSLAGAFVTEAVAPLQGLASYKYTQAAGSLNDYISSPVKAVDPRFRGEHVTLFFPYTFNGSNTSINAIVYCATTAQILSPNSFVQASTSNAVFKTNVTVPLTCTGVRIGFQVKSLSSGSVFNFDSVQLTSDTTVYADIANDIQSSYISNSATLSGGSTLAVAFTSQSGAGVFSYNPGTGIYTALKKCTFSITAAMRVLTTSTAPRILLNGAVVSEDFSTTGASWTSASWTGSLNAGDYLSITNASSGGTSSDLQRVTVTATASNRNIITAPDTFSTDTAPLVFKASAVTANDPIGTFSTGSYAINSNTLSVNGTAPTQTIADMNQNGILLYARAYNAASTAAQPARIEIQIGKGLKGVTNTLYKSSGKINSATLDFYRTGSTSVRGAMIKSYNEVTGILVIDAGVVDTTETAHNFLYSDVTGQAYGYLVINASKNPALTGLNINTVAARGVQTSQQSVTGTDTRMVFDATKSFDTHNALVSSGGSNGLFTAPQSGYYRVNASIQILPVSAWGVGNLIAISGYKNVSTLLSSSSLRVSLSSVSSYIVTYSDLVYLAANETFEIKLLQNSGVSASLTNASSVNFFSITKTSVG